MSRTLPFVTYTTFDVFQSYNNNEHGFANLKNVFDHFDQSTFNVNKYQNFTYILYTLKMPVTYTTEKASPKMSDFQMTVKMLYLNGMNWQLF